MSFATLPLGATITVPLETYDVNGCLTVPDSTPTLSVWRGNTSIIGNVSMITRYPGSHFGNLTLGAGNLSVGETVEIKRSVTVLGNVSLDTWATIRLVAAEGVTGVPKVDVSAFGGTAGNFTNGHPAVIVGNIAGQGGTLATLLLQQADINVFLAGGQNVARASNFPANFASLSLTNGQTIATQASLDALVTTVGVAGAGLTALAQASIWTSTVANRIDVAVSTRAVAGDAMALTSGERTTLANVIESEIIDDTDSEKVLEAITNKIASVNPDLGNLSIGTIAAGVWLYSNRQLTNAGNITSTGGTITIDSGNVTVNNFTTAAKALLEVEATDALNAYAPATASALATIGTNVSSVLTTVNHGTHGNAALKTLIDVLDSVVDAILADTGTDGVVVAAGSKSGYSLAAAGLDSVLIEAAISAGASLTNDTGTQLTSINGRQALALLLSALAGVLAGANTSTTTMKPAGKPAGNDRISATVGPSGRSALTLKVPD